MPFFRLRLLRPIRPLHLRLPRLPAPAILAALLLSSPGCLVIEPSRDRAHFAPLLSVEELTLGVTLYHLRHHRWPLTPEEIASGLAFGSTSPDLLREVATVTLVERSTTSALYKFTFASGGDTELRINLNSPAR